MLPVPPSPHIDAIAIDDPGDPRVAPYLNVKDRDLARADGPGGLFLVEGELVVAQLPGSRLRAESVLVTPGRLASMGPVLAALGCPVYIASPEVMNRIVGFNIHRGVLAAARRGPGLTPGAVAAGAEALLVAEDLSNHDNTGGLFRTLAGLAGPERSGVILSPRSCDPLYRKSVRVSVGQALRVPFAFEPDWPGGLEALRAAGFTLVAATLDPSAMPLDECPPVERPALLVGAEGPGLTPQALAKAEWRVRIPMRGGVDSLNVVVAAGIVLARLLARR